MGNQEGGSRRGAGAAAGIDKEMHIYAVITFIWSGFENRSRPQRLLLSHHVIHKSGLQNINSISGKARKTLPEKGKSGKRGEGDTQPIKGKQRDPRALTHKHTAG